MDVHVQLITFWSQANSRWQPQMADIGKHRNGNNSVNFTNIALRLGVIVVEND